MRIFALLQGQTVENVVVCESQELANQLWRPNISIDVTDLEQRPDIGWIYDGEGFSPPPTPEPTPTPTPTPAPTPEPTPTPTPS